MSVISELTEVYEEMLKGSYLCSPILIKEAVVEIERLQEELAALKAVQPTKSPFSECKFTFCDLPGQCINEGKCHHPATKSQPDRAELIEEIIACLGDDVCLLRDNGVFAEVADNMERAIAALSTTPNQPIDAADGGEVK